MVKPCPRILHNVWHLFSASALLGSCTPSCQTSKTIQKVKSSQIPHPQPLLSISQIHSKRLQAAVYPWSKEKYRLKCKEWHQQAVINVMYHGHTTRTSPSYHRDITKTQPTFCEDTAKTLNWNQVTGALVTSRPVSASVPRQNRKCSKQQASLFPKGVSKNLGKPCSFKKDWYTKLKQTNKLRSRALGRNESQRNQIWTFTRPERNTPFLGHVGAMLGLCGTYVGSIMLTARTKAQKQRSNPVIISETSQNAWGTWPAIDRNMNRSFRWLVASQRCRQCPKMQVLPDYVIATSLWDYQRKLGSLYFRLIDVYSSSKGMSAKKVKVGRQSKGMSQQWDAKGNGCQRQDMLQY